MNFARGSREARVRGRHNRISLSFSRTIEPSVDESLAAIVWKQRQRPCTRRPLLDRLDRLAPRKLLRIVDLAQIQHVTLHNPPAADAPILHNAESPVLLAVLPSNLRAQKHDGRNYPHFPNQENSLGRHYSRFANLTSAISMLCVPKNPQSLSEN